ncbi:MAG: transposase [Bdellovibrionia bacterium]
MKGIREEIKLRSNQKRRFNSWIAAQNHIYKAKCEEDWYYFQQHKNAASLSGLRPNADQCYSHLRQNIFKSVPSQILRNGAFRWMEAKKRFFKKLAGNPRPKKGIKRSCLITNELFTIVIAPSYYSDEWVYKFSFVGGVGEVTLRLSVHTPIPKMLSLSRSGGRYFLSFCYEDGLIQRSQAQLFEEIKKLNPATLASQTLGVDRGVAVNAALSNGLILGPNESEKAAAIRKARRKLKWEKHLARAQKGSKNRLKLRNKLNKVNAEIANLRANVNHRISKQISKLDSTVIAFEKLKTKNMTKRAKAKADPVSGKWLRNNGNAKSGLNRAILNAAPYQLFVFTQYKAFRANKLVMEVNPAYSSQECSACGHTEEGNRKSQSDFQCLKCKHAENADLNASKVVKRRGILDLLAGKFVPLDESKIKVKARRTRVTVCGGDVRGGNQGSHPVPMKQKPNSEKWPTHAIC